MAFQFGPADNPELYRFVENDGLFCGGTRVKLTLNGRRVLGVLLANAGSCVMCRRIVDQTQGIEHICNEEEFARHYVREIRRALDDRKPFEAVVTDRGLGYIFSWNVFDVGTKSSAVGALIPSEAQLSLNSELWEKTYLRYREDRVLALDTSATSQALALRYNATPLTFADRVFSSTILWRNDSELIDPDTILGTLDTSDPKRLTSTPTLSTKEFPAAHQLIKSVYERGPIKIENLEYCVNKIDLTGHLPRIDGRLGFYYDTVLTQFAIGWELKKALKVNGPDALSRGRRTSLPLREGAERGGNPLYDGTQRSSALSVCMLIVFERPEQGLWSIVHRRSNDVGLDPGMLHVVPAGMFEVRNRLERWSVKRALWRELLEEVYNEEEEQGGGVLGFEDDLEQREPILSLSRMMNEGRAELSLTGICCDLRDFRTEICAVLFVRDPLLTKVRRMHLNWEYEAREAVGSFGTPWNTMKEDMKQFRVGEIVPTGLACMELGRAWLENRHRV